MASGSLPRPPREGEIWWSVAPPAENAAVESGTQAMVGIQEEQLKDWLSCTAGWKALELTWGAIHSCDVRHHQLKPLLQAAMSEAERLGAAALVVRQLDVDEVIGRCLALALSAFPNFTALKLRELNLYDEAMGHLSGALHAAEHLRGLVLDSVWASAGGWVALGAAIKVNTSLTSLRMRYCLGGAAVAALCSCLADQRGQLATLRLSHNSLRDGGVEELCKALTRSCTQPANRPSRIAHLDLSYNGVGRQCVPAVAAMLRTVRTLRHFDLSYNDLGAEAVRELCSAMSYAPHVTSLNLAATGADDSAVEALTRGSLAPASAFAVAASGLSGLVVSGPGSLAALCVAHNRITSRGAALLAAAVRLPGCPLLEVDLAGNALMGSEGAKAWAEALSAPSPSAFHSSSSASSASGGGCRLRRLVLSGCEVPDAGAFALGAALKANSSLQELGLAENHISTAGLALLAEVLKVNCSLLLLDVSYNMVGPRGLTPLTQMSQDVAGHSGAEAPLSKTCGGDPAAQRGGRCVIRAELLREYREVEAVKHSAEPWEQEERQGQQQRQQPASPSNAYINPFLDERFAGAAAASGVAAERGGDYNPFLSPSATYVNPFLEPNSAAVANPFLEPPAARGTRAPVGAVGPRPDDNPFASQPVGYDNPFVAPAAAPGGVEGRELATRVVTRLGTHGLGSGGSGHEAGADDHDQGGRCSGSDSGTAVYVSSRSTADEADLVTDLDLRLVDCMLRDLAAARDSGPRHEPGSFIQSSTHSGLRETKVGDASAPSARSARRGGWGSWMEAADEQAGHVPCTQPQEGRGKGRGYEIGGFGIANGVQAVGDGVGELKSWLAGEGAGTATWSQQQPEPQWRSGSGWEREMRGSAGPAVKHLDLEHEDDEPAPNPFL